MAFIIDAFTFFNDEGMRDSPSGVNSRILPQDQYRISVRAYAGAVGSCMKYT
jgi:hypothetical protein